MLSLFTMEIDSAVFNGRKEKAKTVYDAQREVYCPYFKTPVVLNSDGFHHLQFSGRRERTKLEQLVKFRLLPLALQVIRNSGTVQEFRKLLAPVGKTSKHDGSVQMKEVEYWAFVAIVGDMEHRTRVRTIVRRVGTGNLTFWSVMPHSKIKNGKQKLSSTNIEDE